MGHKMGKDIGVQHHDDANNRAKRNRMPNDEAKDDAFIAQLIGRSSGHAN